MVTDDKTPPPLERIPDGPVGMLTVTLVRCQIPAVGTNTAASPSTCQLPLTAGCSVGMGLFASSGSENTTRMSPPPFTSVSPLAGVVETRCSGPFATVGDFGAVFVDLVPPDALGEVLALCANPK